MRNPRTVIVATMMVASACTTPQKSGAARSASNYELDYTLDDSADDRQAFADLLDEVEGRCLRHAADLLEDRPGVSRVAVLLTGRQRESGTYVVARLVLFTPGTKTVAQYRCDQKRGATLVDGRSEAGLVREITRFIDRKFPARERTESRLSSPTGSVTATVLSANRGRFRYIADTVLALEEYLDSDQGEDQDFEWFFKKLRPRRGRVAVGR
jgi:hypothetical protein